MSKKLTTFCEYCEKDISTRNFTTHQKTKICIERQIKMGITPRKTYEQLELELEKIKEELVEKTLQLQQTELKVVRYETENQLYREFYGKLEFESKEEQKDTKKLLLQLASKPTITNTQNNVFNNLTPLDLSEERIKKALPMYTMPHYLRGAEGMADFLIENLLTDEKGNSMYACNDKNRCYFQYKDLSGAKIDDIKCQRLIDTVKPYLAPRVSAFKKERDDWIMATYGDSDEAYEFTGGQNLIGRKQMENHKLNNKAFDIAKIMVLRHK